MKKDTAFPRKWPYATRCHCLSSWFPFRCDGVDSRYTETMRNCLRLTETTINEDAVETISRDTKGRTGRGKPRGGIKIYRTRRVGVGGCRRSS